jgi:hypothetical protein
MEKKPPASGAVAGIASFLLFGLVIFAAVALFIYRNASGYLSYGDNNSEPMARRNATPYPAAPVQTATPLPIPTPNWTPPITSSPTPPTPSGGNANNEASDPNSKYDYVVTGLTELRSQPSDKSGERLETLYEGDFLILNFRKSEESKWYNVTTQSDNDGWVDGNFIEER